MKRGILFENFCIFMKKHDYKDIPKKKMFRKYVSAKTVQNDTSQNKEIERRFDAILRGFDQVVDTMNINNWMSVSWNRYPFPEKLPRMLWQSEPMTHIFGNPIDKQIDNEKRVSEGKKESERTLVIFRKNAPDKPVYFVLFNEDNKIVSWLLINQGGLHYWIHF